MNIRYLEILEAVAETGSFTKAAKKLFITQSAVSHAVAELEEETGTALFDRVPKGAALTACGRALLEESQNILIACRNLERRMPYLEEDTPLHIVSSITIAAFLLPEILTRFRRQYPQFRVFVKIASAETVIDVLRHGEADLAFWEAAAPEGDFAIVTLGSYRLSGVCAPDFALPDRSISMQQLCSYPLLLREQGSAIRDTFDRVLSLANLKAEPVWESTNSLALAKAAEAGLGIAVLPELLTAEAVAEGRLRTVELNTCGLENQMLALYQKNQYITKPLRLLIEMIKSGVASYSSTSPVPE